MTLENEDQINYIVEIGIEQEKPEQTNFFAGYNGPATGFTYLGFH